MLLPEDNELEVVSNPSSHWVATDCRSLNNALYEYISLVLTESRHL